MEAESKRLLLSLEWYIGLVSLWPHKILSSPAQSTCGKTQTQRGTLTSACTDARLLHADFSFAARRHKGGTFSFGSEKRTEIWVPLLNQNVWNCFLYDQLSERRASVWTNQRHKCRARVRDLSEEGLWERAGRIRETRSSFWNRMGGSCGCGAELMFCCGNPEGVRQQTWAARTITAEMHRPHRPETLQFYPLLVCRAFLPKQVS